MKGPEKFCLGKGSLATIGEKTRDRWLGVPRLAGAGRRLCILLQGPLCSYLPKVSNIEPENQYMLSSMSTSFLLPIRGTLTTVKLSLARN